MRIRGMQVRRPRTGEPSGGADIARLPATQSPSPLKRCPSATWPSVRRPRRHVVAGRAIRDIVRTATLGSYGVTGSPLDHSAA